MEKYRIICKACNTIHGYTNNPAIEGHPAKCSSCGMERIAVEKVPDIIHTSKEFDLFISNKRTGLSKSHGFILGVESLKGKSEDEIQKFFIDSCAQALGDILKDPANINILLKDKNN